MAVKGPTKRVDPGDERSPSWRADSQVPAQTQNSPNTDVAIDQDTASPVLEARIVERDDREALAEEVRHLREEMAHRLWVPEGENVVHAQLMPTENTKCLSIAHQHRLILLFCVLILVAVAVVLGITLGRGGGGGKGTEQLSVKDLLLTEPLFHNDTLNDVESPQYKAMMWLMNNDFLDNYSDWQRLQRFALATLYFSTNGDNWQVNTDWVTKKDECFWYNKNPGTCNEDRKIVNLTLESNNMNGKIPVELGLLSDSLERLVFSVNSLTGTIPSEIGLMRRAEQIFFHENSLTGTIPTEIGLFKIMKEFYLENNELNGAIPTEIALMAPSLGRILFGHNHLYGTIPTELALLTDLQLLNIEQNRFSGSILSEIGLLTNRLILISIHDNALTGTIPKEISSLMLLEELHLQNNLLTGTIPEGTLRMPVLDVLILYNNSLTGNYTCAENVSTCMISCDNNSSEACRSL